MEQIVERDGGHFLLVTGNNDTEPREAPLSGRPGSGSSGGSSLVKRQAWMCPHLYWLRGLGERLMGRPLSTVGAWKVVQRYIDEVGLMDVKLHDFRRFVGTQLAKTDIPKAQRALGHKRIDTTAAHYVLDELEPNLTDDLY